jgi:hypothetical protein
MKSLVIFILLLTSFAYGQNAKQTKDFNLKGSWTVTKYTFADITAMTDKIATEWKGKKATVAKVIHFPYYDIPTYKDIFQQSYCGYIEKRHLYPDTVVATEKYFEQFKINHTKLGLSTKTIRIVRTNCAETPFKEMIVKNDNEIIIFWDGTFFTLTRDKK